MSDALLCYCTCPDDAVAQRLAEGLVTAQLAACVNRVPGVTSVYRWQGEVQTDAEVLLLIKTDVAHYPALEEWLQREHPYELPELIAVPLATGSRPYLEWLHRSLV
ncbi:MAG TPA: divalent-cation tolerance protein CutA [Gammaproteobacteria bacterium]|nr:divalent-cation tolerance protein CutA [Gammaproteobacteria bacterium]